MSHETQGPTTTGLSTPPLMLSALMEGPVKQWKAETSVDQTCPPLPCPDTPLIILSLNPVSTAEGTASSGTALTFRVRPQEVTHGSIMGYLLLPVNRPDLVQGLDGRGEAPMHTEDLEGSVIPERMEVEAQRPTTAPPPRRSQPTYLAIDDGRQAEVVKDLSAVAPDSH